MELDFRVVSRSGALECRTRVDSERSRTRDQPESGEGSRLEDLSTISLSLLVHGHWLEWKARCSSLSSGLVSSV